MFVRFVGYHTIQKKIVISAAVKKSEGFTFWLLCKGFVKMEKDVYTKGKEVIEVLNNQDLTKTVPLGKEIIFKVPNLYKFKYYDKEDIIKDKKGIYALINNKRIFYIGKTSNITQRLKSHRRVFNFDSLLFYHVNSNYYMSIYERVLIIKYKPIMNKEIERWAK